MLKYRLLGAIIGIVAGSLLFLFPLGTTKKRFALLPECNGHIESIVIHFNPDLDKIVHKPIAAFLKALGAGVNVYFVCSSKEDIERAKQKYSAFHIEYLLINKQITGWSKDRFLATRNQIPYILSPRVDDSKIPGRNEDASVPAFLARSITPTQFKHVQLSIAFDAGDILCSGDKTIVSDVLLDKNRGIKNLPNNLSSLFAGQIVYLTNVPRHHIGMFAAPLSDQVVAVGDVNLASKLIKKPFDQADCSQKTAKLFDNAAVQLQRAGYKVCRVPTIVFGEKTFITYTNGIFESGRVYMPTYGIPDLDNYAENVYESQGLKVIRIPVGDVYKLHGTIGCLVNVIKRRN